MTLPGSSGACPATLAPCLGLDRGKIPLHVPPQVSNHFYILYMYSTDLNERNRTHAGSIYTVSGPLLRGSKHDNRDCARSLRAIVSPFWGINIAYICEVFGFIPCRCVHFSSPRRYGCTSAFFSLLHLVRLFFIAKLFLTHSTH